MEQVRNEHIEEFAVVEIENSMKEEIPKQAKQADLEVLHTIYRVPKLLRQANDKDFEPQLLSIGPFHHGKEGLEPMEQKKLRYVGAILSRNGKELKDYVKEIMKVEAQARECYSESIGHGRNELAKMMVVDGCFLVEMFLRIRTKYQEKTLPQFISQEIWLSYFISYDMLLLENQIPFFILEHIFRLVKEPGSIKDLVLFCFRLIHVVPLNNGAKAKENYHHLLDLFHHHCLPHDEADPDENRPVSTRTEEQSPANREVRIEGMPVEVHSRQEVGRSEFAPLREPLFHQVKPREEFRPNPEVRIERTPVEEPVKKSGLLAIPSAEELHDAGIKFKRKEETPGSFLDIEFDRKGGVMKIPYLFVSDNLGSFLVNLIAYEQCYPSAGTYFTGYAWFMDDLINTAKDVRILRKSRILEHGVGSDEELAKHFNQLSKGVFIHPEATHLCDQREEINDYCGKPWNSWRASLVRQYFYSPWAAISLAGALLALALTIFNTGLSIYSTFYA